MQKNVKEFYDIFGVDPENVKKKGQKDDQGKPPMQLLPDLREIADVFGFGAYGEDGCEGGGYGQDDWRHLHWSRLVGALLRHLAAWWCGLDERCPKSKKRHIACVAACAIMLVWLTVHRPDLDDRYKGEAA